MAHPQQAEFCLYVKSIKPHLFKGKVLDAGSLDINGNNRYLFEGCEYTGIDVGEGNNVDVVCSAHEFKGGPYDVVISTEMLEHNKYAKESLTNLLSLIRPGGLFLLTCAGYGRQEHGTTRTSPKDAPFTNDYYMNVLAHHLTEWIDFDESFTEYEISKKGFDVRFWGIKR